jgi:hypothetical protein
MGRPAAVPEQTLLSQPGASSQSTDDRSCPHATAGPWHEGSTACQTRVNDRQVFIAARAGAQVGWINVNYRSLRRLRLDSVFGVFPIPSFRITFQRNGFHETGLNGGHGQRAPAEHV